MAATVSRRWLRQTLVRHRRTLSAACAFLAVLFALSSLTRPPSSDDLGVVQRSAGDGTERVETSLASAGLVAAPVRLADADAAALLQPGTHVDLIAADGRGKAVVVADTVEVLEVPSPDEGSLGGGSFGGALVVLAVTPTQATDLAASAAVGPLSVVLHG
ncbi:MAG TPA: hypothetical protein VMT88_08825 [Actinomycetes bacterium]|nr:hypothetical protein [Actinomycetes bacterium]